MSPDCHTLKSYFTEHVTDTLFPYCRKQSLLRDHKLVKNRPSFFFFFFPTIARINVDSVPFCKPQIVQFGNVCRENAGLMVRSGLRSEPLGYGWGKDDVLS